MYEEDHTGKSPPDLPPKSIPANFFLQTPLLSIDNSQCFSLIHYKNLGAKADGTQSYGTGIFTQNGNCLIANNYIEGLHGSAIRIETDSADFTHTANNVTIRGNVVKKTRGSYAITVEAVGDKIEISDNVIDEILDEDASTGYAAGIQIATYAASDGITRLRIKRNTIRGFATSLELARGIWIVRSTNHTISDVVIEGNEIDNVTQYGIALSGEVAISGLRILNNRILNVDTANGHGACDRTQRSRS